MITFRFSATLVATAFVLTSCAKKMSDEDLICDPIPGLIGNPIAGQPINSSDQEAQVFSCIHKWGYRLGRAPGSNSEIAKAVLGRCRGGIDNFLDLKVKEGNASKQPFIADAWQGWEDRFEESALLRVVEGRAGECSIRGEDQK